MSKKLFVLKGFFVFKLLFFSSPSNAFTANRVWYEVRTYFIRINVSYTIPEFREKREAYIEFKDPKKAAETYWALVRGADFFLYSPDRIRFVNSSQTPDPW